MTPSDTDTKPFDAQRRTDDLSDQLLKAHVDLLERDGTIEQITRQRDEAHAAARELRGKLAATLLKLEASEWQVKMKQGAIEDLRRRLGVVEPTLHLVHDGTLPPQSAFVAQVLRGDGND